MTNPSAVQHPDPGVPDPGVPDPGVPEIVITRSGSSSGSSPVPSPDPARRQDRAARAVAQWGQVRPEIDASPMLPLGRMSELVHRIRTFRLEPGYGEHGLNRGEFDVLATLRRSGVAQGLTPTALYGALMVSSGGMTNRIDRLERLGLVARRPHPDDRRGTLVALTPAGLALIDRLVDRHVAVQRAILAPLTPDEQDQLSALLGKLLDGLEPEG